MPTMSSAALPKVALSSPPSPGPRWHATASVAVPIHRARGTSARAARTKTRVPACSQAATTAAGMNTSRTRKTMSAPLEAGTLGGGSHGRRGCFSPVPIPGSSC